MFPPPYSINSFYTLNSSLIHLEFWNCSWHTEWGMELTLFFPDGNRIVSTWKQFWNNSGQTTWVCQPVGHCSEASCFGQMWSSHPRGTWEWSKDLAFPKTHEGLGSGTPVWKQPPKKEKTKITVSPAAKWPWPWALGLTLRGVWPLVGLTHQGFRQLARRHWPLALKMTPVRARGPRPAPQPLRGPRSAIPGRPCALAHPPAQRLQTSLKFHCLALQPQETWENQLQLVSHHFPIDAVKEPHPSSLPWGWGLSHPESLDSRAGEAEQDSGSSHAPLPRSYSQR